MLGGTVVPCMIAGWAYKFIVAHNVEPMLIGLDFLRSHRATWDWLIEDLGFQ